MIGIKVIKPSFCGGCGVNANEAELSEITMTADGRKAKRLFVCCPRCMALLNDVITEFLKGGGNEHR